MTSTVTVNSPIVKLGSQGQAVKDLQVFFCPALSFSQG